MYAIDMPVQTGRTLTEADVSNASNAAQAHAMAEALRIRGVPHALVEFPDEGHGFRKADNVVRALEAELAFFARCFGFDPADDLPALHVEG